MHHTGMGFDGSIDVELVLDIWHWSAFDELSTTIMVLWKMEHKQMEMNIVRAGII